MKKAITNSIASLIVVAFALAAIYFMWDHFCHSAEQVNILQIMGATIITVYIVFITLMSIINTVACWMNYVSDNNNNQRG
jgi:uncharacterized membrane protein YcfT